MKNYRIRETLKQSLFLIVTTSLVAGPVVAQDGASFRQDREIREQFERERERQAEEQRRIAADRFNEQWKSHIDFLESDHEQFKNQAAHAQALNDALTKDRELGIAWKRTTIWTLTELRGGNEPSEDDIVKKFNEYWNTRGYTRSLTESETAYRDRFKPYVESLGNFLQGLGGGRAGIAAHAIGAMAPLYDEFANHHFRPGALLEAQKQNLIDYQDSSTMTRSSDMSLKIASIYPAYQSAARTLLMPRIGFSLNSEEPSTQKAVESAKNSSPIKTYESFRQKLPPQTKPKEVVAKLIDAYNDRGVYHLGKFHEQLKKDPALSISFSQNVEIAKPQMSAEQRYELRSEQLKMARASILMATGIADLFDAPREMHAALVAADAMVQIAMIINTAQVATYATTAAAAAAAGSVTFGIGAVVVVAAATIAKMFNSNSNHKALMRSIQSLKLSMDRHFAKIDTKLNVFEARMHGRFDQIMEFNLGLYLLCAESFRDIHETQARLTSMIDVSLNIMRDVQMEVRNVSQLVRQQGEDQVVRQAKLAHSRCLDDFDKNALYEFVSYGTEAARSSSLLTSRFPNSNESWLSASFLNREYSRIVENDPNESPWLTLKLSRDLNRSVLASTNRSALDWRLAERNLVNPLHWIRASQYFLECITNENLDLSQMSPSHFESLIESGEETQQTLESFDSSSLKALLSNLRSATTQVADKIKKAQKTAMRDLNPEVRSISESVLPARLPVKVNLSKLDSKEFSKETKDLLSDKLRDLSFKVESDFRKSFETKLGDIAASGLAAPRIKIRVMPTQTRTVEEIHEYKPFDHTQEPPSQMDNVFISNKWQRIRTDDRAYYFMPIRYHGNGHPVEAFQFDTNKSILPELPQLEWKMTYVDVRVDFDFELVLSEEALSLNPALKQKVKRENDQWIYSWSDVTQSAAIMIAAKPVRRTFDFEAVMKRLEKAYSDPKLYEGVSKQRAKEIAKNQLEFLRRSINANQYSKIRRTHLREGGFRGGPYPLTNISYQPANPAEQVLEALQSTKLLKEVLKPALPEELKIAKDAKSLKNKTHAFMEGAGLNVPKHMLNSESQLSLNQAFQDLNAYVLSLRSILQTHLSKSIATEVELMPFSIPFSSLGFWDESVWKSEIGHLVSEANKNPKFALILDLKMKELESISLQRITEAESFIKKLALTKKKKGISFGERLIPVDFLLSSLCIGLRQTNEHRGVEHRSTKVNAYCAEVLNPAPAM